MSETLIIFFKSPVPGQVKTRLARQSSPDFATKLYAHLLDKTFKVACRWQALGKDRHLRFWGEGDGTLWPGLGLGLVPMFRQSGESLGHRLELALQQERRSGKVCVIGTDCPGIRVEILDRAFAAITRLRGVIGPCRDGGFYLLGLHALPPCSLSGLPWSSPDTREHVLRRLRGFHVDFSTLPELYDIDSLSDVEDYYRSNETEKTLKPRPPSPF